MTSDQEDRRAAWPDMTAPLVILGLGFLGAIVVGQLLDQGVVDKLGPSIAYEGYALFASLFLWLDRRSAMLLLQAGSVGRTEAPLAVITNAATAALAAPLLWIAIMLSLSALPSSDLVLQLGAPLALALAVIVAFITGLIASVRARRRVMIGSSANGDGGVAKD